MIDFKRRINVYAFIRNLNAEKSAECSKKNNEIFKANLYLSFVLKILKIHFKKSYFHQVLILTSIIHSVFHRWKRYGS